MISITLNGNVFELKDRRTNNFNLISSNGTLERRLNGGLTISYDLARPACNESEWHNILKLILGKEVRIADTYGNAYQAIVTDATTQSKETLSLTVVRLDHDTRGLVPSWNASTSGLASEGVIVKPPSLGLDSLTQWELPLGWDVTFPGGVKTLAYSPQLEILVTNYHYSYDGVNWIENWSAADSISALGYTNKVIWVEELGRFFANVKDRSYGTAFMYSDDGIHWVRQEVWWWSYYAYDIVWFPKLQRLSLLTTGRTWYSDDGGVSWAQGGSTRITTRSGSRMSGANSKTVIASYDTRYSGYLRLSEDGGGTDWTTPTGQYAYDAGYSKSVVTLSNDNFLTDMSLRSPTGEAWEFTALPLLPRDTINGEEDSPMNGAVAYSPELRSAILGCYYQTVDGVTLERSRMSSEFEQNMLTGRYIPHKLQHAVWAAHLKTFVGFVGYAYEYPGRLAHLKADY